MAILRWPFCLGWEPPDAASKWTFDDPAAPSSPAPAAAVDVGARLAYPYVLPSPPYGYDANEPTIDAETMRLPRDMPHAASMNNLNAARRDRIELHDVALPDLLARVETLQESVRAAVRNNGGGHAWHTMFWQVMGGRDGGSRGQALAGRASQPGLAPDGGAYGVVRQRRLRARLLSQTPEPSAGLSAAG